MEEITTTQAGPDLHALVWGKWPRHTALVNATRWTLKPTTTFSQMLSLNNSLPFVLAVYALCKPLRMWLWPIHALELENVSHRGLSLSLWPSSRLARSCSACVVMTYLPKETFLRNA